jgi:glycosyltransferase involved in cell wall biosynthesis
VARRESIDLLLLSPGTTAGWRRSDAELVRALEGAGVGVEIVTSEFRLARHLRRTVLTTDLAEAAAMRRALTIALRRLKPRALIYSSPQATMLQPRRRLTGSTAVRFDVPAALNRPGPGNGLLRALERRALASVRLLLPVGLEPRDDARRALALETPMVALPIPVEGVAGADGEREPLALAYAGNPEKKGLDIALAAWARVPPPWRLVVTGIDAAAGRRFLRRQGVAEPERVEWAGLLDPRRYRELLSRAAIFVAASRYEDYGLAQLEALAAGTPLVTVPSEGPYEALPLARELAPALVASAVSSDALADALTAALALPSRASYARRAAELLRPYSRAELRRRLEEEVLPVLLR